MLKIYSPCLFVKMILSIKKVKQRNVLKLNWNKCSKDYFFIGVISLKSGMFMKTNSSQIIAPIKSIFQKLETLIFNYDAINRFYKFSPIFSQLCLFKPPS